MSYSDALDLKISNKFTLICFSVSSEILGNPRYGKKDEGAYFLYKVESLVDFEQLELNDVVLTKLDLPEAQSQSGLPIISEFDTNITEADQWEYVASKNLVLFSSTTDLDNTSENYAIGRELVTLTDADHPVQAQDLLFGTGKSYFYDNKIIGDFSVKESAKNLFYGTLTVGKSSISFFDDNKKILKDIEAGKAIKGSTFVAVHCIDSVENQRVIYEGEITDASFSAGSVSLSVDSLLAKLDKPATFANTDDPIEITRDLYPNAIPSSIGEPIPITLAGTSNFSVRFFSEIKNNQGILFSALDTEFMLKAHCINFDPELPQAGANSQFISGRASSLYFVNIPEPDDFSIVVEDQTYTNAGPTSPRRHFAIIRYGFSISAWEDVQCEIGDSFKINNTSVIVTRIDDATKDIYLVTDYNHYTTAQIEGDGLDVVSNLDFTFNRGPQIAIKTSDFGFYYPFALLDYFLNPVLISGSTLAWEILINPFNLLLFTESEPLNPEIDEIYYRISSSFQPDQVSVVDRIMGRLDFPFNRGALDVLTKREVSLTLPTSGGSEVETYRDVLEMILSSTGDFFTLSTLGNGDFEYVEFNPEGSAVTSYNDNHIIKDSFSVKIDMSEIKSRAVLINRQRPTFRGDGAIGFENGIIENKALASLTGTRVEVRPSNVLLNPIEIVDKLAPRFLEPVITYVFEAGYKKPDIKIGEIINVSSEYYFGDADTRRSLIVAITRKRNTVQIEAIKI